MKTEKEISSWAQALFLATEENPDKFDVIVQNFKKSIKRKHLIPFVFKKFESVYLKEKKVKLFLSHDLPQEEKEEIKSKIKEKIKKIDNFECFLDESLLGGFRLKTKDFLIKASLQDSLIRLKNQINGYN